MALAAADFAVDKNSRTYLGPFNIMLTGTYTLPASYTSGGEVLTNAIMAARFGLKKIRYMSFQPTGGVSVVWDGVSTSTSQGKLHAYQSGLAAHTHSFLVKGGTAAAGTDAINIKGTTPVTIGKEAVTDATNLGGAGGGVQAVAAVNSGTEVVAGQNLSAATAKYVVWGE